MESKRKRFILDTSVLLYDKSSIHSFPGNDVILPLQVIDELDRFKEKPGIVGDAARYVNRFLDELRECGRLDKGVWVDSSLADSQTVMVTIDEDLSKLPRGLAQDRGDNRILATCMSEKAKTNSGPIVVVTKDINLRVKCDALGIRAEDYYKDHLERGNTEYTGHRELTIAKNKIDSFYNDGVLALENEDLSPNECVVMTSSERSSSALGMYRAGTVYALTHRPGQLMSNFESKNKEQAFAVEVLLRDEIELVTLTGLAGSGKTYVALMAGLDGVQQGKYKRIVVSRSIQPVGRDLGYLPGDMDDKMQPWLAPITDNFRTMLSDKNFTYFEMMKERGELEVAPLAYIRGRTFNDSYVIVDEAQNATVHELKTIITRIGKGSKIVLLGDTDQIDTPYINKLSNGLSIVVHKFRDKNSAAHVQLVKGQRSDIASLASLIL
ncbi:MAG TPA: PhoH family protein [Flavobacteriales bacterium]|nr:PhoH family protein [Flavobacteriales bacterium]